MFYITKSRQRHVQQLVGNELWDNMLIATTTVAKPTNISARNIESNDNTMSSSSSNNNSNRIVGDRITSNIEWSNATSISTSKTKGNDNNNNSDGSCRNKGGNGVGNVAADNDDVDYDDATVVDTAGNDCDLDGRLRC